MIISGVPDGVGGAGEGEEEDLGDNSHEYQTASELFELMAKNQNCETNDVDSLTTRDLVLLYKNIDLGSKLMSNASGFTPKKPNQYVETVVYNDDAESDSDISEIYSNEDIRNVVLINKERIDLLNNRTSLRHVLCHKFGDLEIQSLDLNTQYDKNFLFKDPYIKEQLKTLNLDCDADEPILPASLLDYICCKRLEDNYNFYMDNVIRYVKHTIEQLKRISNGDYLTEKAKEKWREMENNYEDMKENNETKVLATSNSIPLQVEHKAVSPLTTWKNIVHSEVDIRSLSKTLEKKIIVEIPRLFFGSYELFNNYRAENLIISCKTDQSSVNETKRRKSRVDVVLQLQRSDSRQVKKNISSIMILQTTMQTDVLPSSNHAMQPPVQNNELKVTQQNNDAEKKSSIYNFVLDVACQNTSSSSNVKIVELDQPEDLNSSRFESTIEKDNSHKCKTKSNSDGFATEDSYLDTIDYFYSNNRIKSLKDSNESCHVITHYFDKPSLNGRNEASFKLVTPDELRVTMHRLNMQTALTEETGEDMQNLPTNTKKKSPTRVRIKSPYENKSFLIEDKKRRRLLEIRERREKKKIALAENCKITKHKYGVMPQHSSSVTRLSITNKSFYDSIYGQSTNSEIQKPDKAKNRKDMLRQASLDILGTKTEIENHCPILSPDRDSKKYTDRSYYLDDAVTEIMYMDMKKNENKDDGKDLFSPSASEVSNDFRANMNLLSQLIGTSVTDIANADFNSKAKSPGWDMRASPHVKDNNEVINLTATESMNNLVESSRAPANSPTKFDDVDVSKINPKKALTSVECRKSIDKIYELLEKFGKPDNIESKPSKIKLRGGNIEKVVVIGNKDSSTIQGSDSGTSLKHRLTSSNPSCYSFDKCNTNDTKHQASVTDKKVNTPTAIIPKVIISSKSQISQETAENQITEQKKKMSDKVTDNPLKAISQLLHEFENVQKIRQKSAIDQKSFKKPDSASTQNNKFATHNVNKRRFRMDRLRDNLGQVEKSPKVAIPRDRKPKQPKPVETAKGHNNTADNKPVDKIPPKKMSDLIDEVKEARGEAVRGPSKLNSRLNTLAQPKRSYVLAHSEEYQYKYGKNLMADRLQRLATSPSPAAADRNRGASILRNRGRRSEPVSTVSVKTPGPGVPPLERPSRFRRSANSSPSEKEKKSPGHGPSPKQNNVIETPETMKKKMVAVETYVKNHYGSSMSPVRTSGPPPSTHVARVPVLPIDLELDSANESSVSPNEEATSLGNKLHRIIDTIINTPHGLGVLTECQESISMTSKDDANNYFPTEHMARSDEQNNSTDSEYNVNIFEDKNVLTAVEDIEKVSNSMDRSSQGTKSVVCELRTTSSVSQLEKLENALSHRISLGIFQKRLRMKNLTLTPKQSMQQVVLLQSGDAGTGSLVIKSTVSQNLTISSETEVLSHLKTLPVFSKSHLDWNYSKFPMQVTTVGYAFPQYKAAQADSQSLKYLNETKIKGTIENHTFDKDSQCYKGEHIQPQSGKLDNRKYMTLSKVTSINEVVTEQSIINQTEESKKTSQTEHRPKEKIELRERDKSSLNTKAQTSITIEDKDAEISRSKKHTNKSILNLLQERAETNQSEDLSITSGETKVLDKNSYHDKSIASGAGNNEIKTSGESVDYTTSLDILVGLLNEIKKITTCQTNITTNSGISDNDAECRELETILNNAAEGSKTSPLDILSLTSLEKLRQLDSNASLYSFYLSDHGEDRQNRKNEFKPEAIPKIIYVDKEIGVDFTERTLVDTLTDVPSKFLPITRSTNITNSLLGLISKPSNQSLISFSVNSESSMYPIRDIIKLPVAEVSDHDTALIPAFATGVIKNLNPDRQMSNIKVVTIQKRASLSKNVVLVRSKIFEEEEFDSTMRMKRDILVTVYSILVFSVFAAISFPRLLMSDVYF